jgi:hypothetical protein
LGIDSGSDGNLYGVGTDNDNFASAISNYVPNIYGIIFRITPAGEFTTLASFYNGPGGPLFQGTDGNLYGTTAEGGPGDSGYGTARYTSSRSVPARWSKPFRRPAKLGNKSSSSAMA